MTDMQPPEVHICPADGLQQELREQIRRMNTIRNDLEAGLQELAGDGGDLEVAEQVRDFLNANTPWEFNLEREYRVQIVGWVTVEALNESDARRMVEDSDWSWSEHGVEPDGFEVQSVEEAR